MEESVVHFLTLYFREAIGITGVEFDNPNKGVQRHN